MSLEGLTNESGISGKLLYRRVCRVQLPRLDSEHFPDRSKGDRIPGSSKFYFVGSVLAARFQCFRLAQDVCAEFASFAIGSTSNGSYRRGGIFMQLKMWVLSGASLLLWLAPLTALDKRIGWHKSMQGLSLCSAVACAITAGNIARKLAEDAEIETIKTRAITADVIDEISTTAYVSQQQRQQEAEAILAAPTTDVEEARKTLEALYSSDFEGEAEVAITTTTDDSLELARKLYAEVREVKEAGKTNTWIIENIFKMKGRKFAEGKVKLQNLLDQFESK